MQKTNSSIGNEPVEEIPGYKTLDFRLVSLER